MSKLEFIRERIRVPILRDFKEMLPHGGKRNLFLFQGTSLSWRYGVYL